MTVAVVLSGGGNLGAAQAGMLCALADTGIRPDLVVGTSVGALNGAFVAGRPWPAACEELAALWVRLRRTDVFPVNLQQMARGLTGRDPHLVSPAPLMQLVREHLTFDRLEDSPTPLVLVATEVLTGRERLLQSGDARSAVLASAALPGVFPPVTVDGEPLMDGGLVNNTPISVALTRGADEVYVLPTGYACALPRPPGSALAMTLHAFGVAVHRRLIDDTVALEGDLRVRVVPPLCPVTVSPLDFARAPELIARARTETARWLRAPRSAQPWTQLALHRHRAVRAQVGERSAAS